LHIAH